MTAADLEVAIVAKDNERTIGETLASVRDIARRIVVVDSGSTDRTPELCREHEAEVVEHAWEGYVKQKQFALDQCASTWVLCLDSDESLNNEAREAVRRTVEDDDADVAGYAINRRIRYGETELRHAWQPQWRVRLVRRATARWEGYDPHDRLEADGPVRRLPGTIVHDAFADIPELVAKAVGHGFTTAQSYYDMGRKGSVLKLVTSTTGAPLKLLVLKGSWRDGWIGWVAAFSDGLHAAVKHMRLLELWRRAR